MNAETKICQNCKNPFVIEQEDFDFYAKIKVPPPTFCFDCRFQRRLLWRNERTFYRRGCGLCGKSIVSTYHEQQPFPVYCQKCWWSDNWDPFSYGRDFDFSRPFFEQFKDLQNSIPALAMMNDDTIASLNCEYSYDFAFAKNCYLTVSGWHSENVSYSYYTDYDKDIVDCYHVNYSQFLYECSDCEKCSQCSWCTLCFESHNCILGFDLRNCSDCLMCWGLRNKSYCILNEQYSKEEYEKKIKEFNLGNRESLQKSAAEFQNKIRSFLRKYANITKCFNSTGDFLLNSKLAKNCFIADKIENGKFMVVNDTSKDCYDCNNTGNSSLSYESVTPDNSNGNKFSIYCWKCTNAEYSNNCHGSNNLLGCSGLRNSEYSILNKKYGKEEFIKLRDKIIEQMKQTEEFGEFFPHTSSPFAYNETAAFDWYPLKKNEATQKGYTWKDAEEKSYQITVKSGDIPVEISQVPDLFEQEIIECAHQGACNHKCTTAFRLTSYELQFYKRMNIPVPFLCPNCRYYERISNRKPIKLWHRQCMCDKNHPQHTDHCLNEFETSYAPDRPEVIYCEQCYQAEIA